MSALGDRGGGEASVTRSHQDKQRENSFLYSENRRPIWSSEDSAGISKGVQWVGGPQTLSRNSCSVILRRPNHALTQRGQQFPSPSQGKQSRHLPCRDHTMPTKDVSAVDPIQSPPNAPNLVKALAWLAGQREP